MSSNPGNPRGWLGRELASMPSAQRREHLLRELCRRTASFLQRDDEVSPDANWVDIGFDSLRAVDFRSELETACDVRLRSTLLFDQPSPRAVATHLLERMALTDSARVASPAAATGSEPIAIVGAACRFPGGESLDAFWQLLRRGGDAIGPIGDDRWPVDQLYDADPNAIGKLYVREAGLLTDIAGFDAALFGISPREAVLLDPQQRLLLETSWHAFEHAGLPPESLQDTIVGVYVGTRASEYFDSQSNRTPADATGYYATGNAISTAAGRISFTFGFRGPCYALDTACSGSLVAVHNAVRALRSRECHTALAGGVNAIIDPVPMAGLCRARMLAPDGRCKTFDARADGYGRGEGCGMIVLKRLADAEADGDRILAVIRGTASNQDGRSSGLTVPHGPSQTAVVREALADAGLDAEQIDYLEAHGTGTSLGDPIEVQALDEVFQGRSRKLRVGSVKTNIGHLEAAAGISGLLKVVLALRHRELPPTLHCQRPNPHIDWQHSVVDVVRERTPLPADRDRHFGGVSSFGFSGTNCHVVLESAPRPADDGTAAATDPPPTTCVLPLHAHSVPALRELARAQADAIADEANAAWRLADWCRAASTARSALPQRAAFVASSREQLVEQLRAFADGDDGKAAASGHAAAIPPRVAFLFPGQGSQFPGMGQELADEEPVFRSALQAATERLDDLDLPAPLTELLWHDDGERLQRTDVTQPALCAYQLALLSLLREYAVVPSAVLGHSVGDFAAAAAAGVLDGGDALALTAARGRLMVERCPTGGMLAVMAPIERWREVLAQHPDCTLAVHNAAANLTVGGSDEHLDTLQRDLEGAGIPHRRLPVSHAFHTAATEPMLADFEQRVAGMRLRPPACTFVLCATGQPAGDEVTTAAHWRRHVREPVRFDRGVQGLAATGCEIWVELGPTAMLSAVVASNGVRDREVVPLQRRNRPARETLLGALAQLWVRGVAVDLARANHARGRCHAPLPAYPFQRQRFWLERGPATQAPSTGGHPLLGERQISSLLQPGQQLHASTVTASAPSWLADHVAFEHVLFPAAGMIECALASEREAGTALPIALEGATLRSPLPLEERPVRLESMRDDARGFVLKSLADGASQWTVHLEARAGTAAAATATDATVDLAGLRERCPDELAPDELYKRCRAAKLDYGPQFRGVQRLRIGRDEAVADVALAEDLPSDGFVLHPALLDACFHTLFAVLPGEDGTFLPIGVDNVTVARAGIRAVVCHTRLRQRDGKALQADLALYDGDGRTVAAIAGLQLVPTDATALRAATGRTRDLLYHTTWQNAPRPTASPAVRGVAIVGDPELATATAAALPIGSAEVCTIDELPAAVLRQRIERIVVLCTAPTDATDGQPLLPQRSTFALALRAAQIAAKSPGPPQLVLVTRGVQPASPGPAGNVPHAASVLGLARTLLREQPQLTPLAIDLDPSLPAERVAEHARELAAELRTRGDEPEVALRAELRRVPRLDRGPVPATALAAGDGPFHVRARSYGSFDHLAARPLVRTEPAADEIEVEVRATALNFKDALHALGMLQEHAQSHGIHAAAEQPLGFEASGIVVATGDDVRDIAVGDRVVVSAQDCLASHCIAKASACFTLPADVELHAAAGLPTVFATVLHALEDLARVRPDDVVLVHAAAGGVGQAAIQLLRAKGCRVLATASPHKHGLVTALGAEVVGNSRTADFTAGVHAATDGRGVDVVLNTLTGKAVDASFAALVTGGRFVELGKLDVWSAEQAGERRPDVQFFAFDLGDEYAADATLQPRLMRRLRDGLARGELRPVQATLVPFADTRLAFEHLAQGRHTGKVVVTMPALPTTSDGCVLLTGASGGIALPIAKELVRAGARHLALVSRRPLPAATRDELAKLDVTVHELQADCANRAAMRSALARLRASAPPLTGIVHAAGVLADGLVATLDWQQAEPALWPKVQGAIVLDELTRDDPLGFFVLLSSMAATLGNPGQAAYAGANTFLDAFADWRRRQGRPATSIAYGPWHGDGMAGRLDRNLLRRLQSAGVDLLPEGAASNVLGEHRGHDRNLVAMAMRWPDWLRAQGDLRTPLLANLQARGDDDAGDSTVDLTGVAADELPERARATVLAIVARVLGFADPAHVDAERTFQEQGLDSLMAVDAKDRLEQAVGQQLPATLLFDHPHLDLLVDHLLRLLRPTDSGATDELDELATDDLARLLQAELEQSEEGA